MQASSLNTNPSEKTSWQKSVGPFSMGLSRLESGEWSLRAHFLSNQCLVRKTLSRDLTLETATWALISELQLVVYGWGQKLEGMTPSDGTAN